MTLGHGRRAGTSPRLHRFVGLALGAASAGAWLAFVAANGFARGNDTRGYLRPADALWSLRVVTSAHTPGLPDLPRGLPGARCRARHRAWLGRRGPSDDSFGGRDYRPCARSGVATHDPARYRCLAAVLFALDVDLQQYGAHHVARGADGDTYRCDGEPPPARRHVAARSVAAGGPRARSTQLRRFSPRVRRTRRPALAAGARRARPALANGGRARCVVGGRAHLRCGSRPPAALVRPDAHIWNL